MANLTVIKVTKIAVIIKIIERIMPALLKRMLKEKIVSMAGFL